MASRLNGWHRLWIVVCVLYLVPVASILYIEWPTFERTEHRDTFITELPSDIRRHVVASYRSEWLAKEDHSEYPHAVLPNGAVLVIRGTADPRLAAIRKKYPQYNDLSDTKLASALRAKFPEYADLPPASFLADEDLQRVVQAYGAVVESAMRAARRSFTWYVFLAWLIPCLTLYALGFAAAWVRRGFRSGTA